MINRERVASVDLSLLRRPRDAAEKTDAVRGNRSLMENPRSTETPTKMNKTSDSMSRAKWKKTLERGRDLDARVGFKIAPDFFRESYEKLYIDGVLQKIDFFF